jgi:hypothetical protein
MRTDLLFETDRFNLSEVKDHFINASCFGEDVARWLRGKLNESGLKVIEPDQEDWGWYIEAELGESHYFIGIGGNADESSNNPNQGEWRIMIEKHRSVWEKLSGKNKMSDKDEMMGLICKVIEAEPDFKNVHYE